MRCLLLSSLSLIALRSVLSAAYPQMNTELRRPSDSPSAPARAFTVRAFALTFAVTGLHTPELTGLPMIARGGNFYLDSSNSTSDSNAPVLSVDATSRAYLVSSLLLPLSLANLDLGDIFIIPFPVKPHRALNGKHSITWQGEVAT